MKIYGVYRNADLTEGRGAMLLDKLFERQANAEQYRRQQKDYPGWPMWEVRELDVEPARPDDHTPVYGQGACSCGWQALAPLDARPEVWDAAIDKHIAEPALDPVEVYRTVARSPANQSSSI